MYFKLEVVKNMKKKIYKNIVNTFIFDFKEYLKFYFGTKTTGHFFL